MAVAVVSGGSRGIGKAIIERFAKEKFDIITCGRTHETLDLLKDEVEGDYGVNVTILKADLSIKKECERFNQFVSDFTSKIDVLVNNTGFFTPGRIYDEPEGNLELMINTNLYSSYHITRGLLPLMIPHHTGHIFNICSIASITAYPNGGAYSISKFAQLGLTKVLREELKTMGIRVTAVLPGATLTDSWEGVDLPASRFVQSQDVAESVYGCYVLSHHAVVEELIIRPQLGDI